MSFSAEVKAELTRIEIEKNCCMLAQLSAVLRMNGDLVIRRGNFGINFITENAALARQVLKLLKQQFKVSTEVVVTRSRRLKKNNRYQVRILPAAEVLPVVNSLRLLPGDDGRLENDLLLSPCCRRCFLRGVFMASGSVNKPEGDYHLEIITSNKNFADTILRVMKYFDLPVKLTDRKNEYIIYLKGGDYIIYFLSVIGAHNALLKFENVRVVKQMRNQVNRLVNCETANLDKTVQAALRQVESINFLKSKEQYWCELTVALREAAELRLAYPDSTLSELVELNDSNISKSGLNHRLKKIERLAIELGMERK